MRSGTEKRTRLIDRAEHNRRAPPSGASAVFNHKRRQRGGAGCRKIQPPACRGERFSPRHGGGECRESSEASGSPGGAPPIPAAEQARRKRLRQVKAIFQRRFYPHADQSIGLPRPPRTYDRSDPCSSAAATTWPVPDTADRRRQTLIMVRRVAAATFPSGPIPFISPRQSPPRSVRSNLFPPTPCVPRYEAARIHHQRRSAFISGSLIPGTQTLQPSPGLSTPIRPAPERPP